MLVLGRKVGEAIRIGDVRVMVVDVDRNKVRIGIEADRSVPIYREELLDPKAKELPPSQGNAAYNRLVRARAALERISEADPRAGDLTRKLIEDARAALAELA